ncbi:MAG TPA: beta-galactosidase trimerization domain-containing protein [Bryobacteraceae bacterium]|nr:beta-galactosidase trimerization domain-containing protein [Bryobacteraceae bacterium]HPQ16821.1 beta-galactosidase trimerization domain-containing protein [Bryobacteraceae bacterium]HPU72600.1 beta-galactosidase trimerization domain-containing protein [Bryobacteraceae bacterium]
MTDLTRRVFIGSTAGFVFAGGSAAQQQPEWFDRPMRWAQLTLVENDPGRYDPGFWLDYFRRTHSDAVCLSAGGCVAYYPTKIPLHYKSPWMKDTDPFGELVAGCRKLNMVVVARTDSHAAHQDVYDAHPDWIAVDAQGRKRRHWASPDLWVTCALGPYNFEFMTEVTREIVSMYRVDGIFTNRWAGSGMCYCEHCQKNFRAAYGMDLPRTNDPRDPARRNYLLWRQQRLFELWRLWDSEIRKINPNARYIANAGGGAMSDLDMKTIGELAPTLFADRQARRGLMPPWTNGKNGKEYRATLGRKAIVGIFSVGVEEPHRWKDSVQRGEEIRVWVADGIANGLRPWFTKFSGYLYDRRWLKVVEDIYNWHYRCERYLRNEEPLARVAMVYSQQTAMFYGGPQAQRKVEDHTLGMYHALIEARVPFEMVHDRLLDAEHVDKFKLLILPNIAALSDAQCEQLRRYVARGGSILATYETSLYDEWGERRSDFGLADLFGASFRGLEGPVRNSYLNIEKDPATGGFHPILAGLEDAGRIINGVLRVDAVPRGKIVNPPLTLIPSYPDLPMEAVYPRVPKTDIPGVFLREMGKSRIVYFPWDIDRVFWEVMAPDHGTLLANAVKWATNEDPPVEVTGPGVLDITVWRQKESMTVHLVNLTNPMMMKGPFREIYPVGEQRVRVRLPGGLRPRKVQLLVNGGTPRTQEAQGYLTVFVPSISIHEVVAIDL